ncbi:MAG: hypothetical protein NTX65_02160 [Ignavibacteriales bacterium]|nr:hypothetical protein [Ignavibacteriales bacterium]
MEIIKPNIQFRDSIFIKIKTAKNLSEADSIFNNFYKKYRYTFPSFHMTQNSPNAMDSINAFFLKNGFRIADNEGDAFNLVINTDYLLKNIGKYISPTLVEYYNIIDEEDKNEDFYEDGGMRITFDELGDRILRWEKFLLMHNDFSQKVQIERTINRYEHFYLIPMDYHPLFNSGTKQNKLDPNILMIYKRYVLRNPNTDFGKYMSEYLIVLENNNYEYNNNVKQYLKSIDPDVR